MITSVLVIGGQRSGKSLYAEGLVAGSARRPVYLATATAGDSEMAERIALHRRRRGASWRTVEEPLDLAAALDREAGAENAVLVECLALWLSNLFGAASNIDDETTRLIAAIRRLAGSVVFVSNEVGSGIVPDNALARAYADALGTLNQKIAAVVDHVVLVAAGQPVLLKPAPRPEIAL